MASKNLVLASSEHGSQGNFCSRLMPSLVFNPAYFYRKARSGNLQGHVEDQGSIPDVPGGRMGSISQYSLLLRSMASPKAQDIEDWRGHLSFCPPLL